MYSIKLDDGTEIEAHLNMNTWESDTEPDDSVFENNTSNVSYTDPDGNVVELGECNYVRGIQDDTGKYLFFLNPITDAERAANTLNRTEAQAFYTAVATDTLMED